MDDILREKSCRSLQTRWVSWVIFHEDRQLAVMSVVVTSSCLVSGRAFQKIVAGVLPE